MRKITNFIVKGRYIFLALFVIMAIFSLHLMTKVNINEDIMEYLPKTSETKIGKDIMEEEFPKEDTSVLNVMFKNLTNKNDTLKKLENIKGVSSVSYENTDEYNKNKYTLYVLNVDDYADSKKASNVYNYVKDNFKPAGMSGSIYDENKPILQLWIVGLAIVCAMIILIIISDSYLEPWLYLISIGIAVFINKGTNIMFDSVSSITNSIVAILQLALSMDYSIMLSNRYKQEKKIHLNKIEAMKEALYHSFKSISSSSVTTIVGLLALIFMSFTIGRDLGFVLAKGVLLSLISIFFCLPALLLMFDNLILKTQKKSPKFNLTKLGNYIYKTRYIQSILIIGIFIVSYLLKGNIAILYTGSEQDKVGAVFKPINQVAIVYNNKYEDFISSYCKKLEKDKKIDQVLCYSNTINEELTYDKLNDKFKDLGQNTKIDDYLIKLIYYKYYNQNEDNKMSLNDFISFIKSDIYTNNNFKDLVDQNTKDNINLLENFISPSLINQKRNIEEIASILGMKKEDAKNILIYYNSKNVKTKMTIKEFLDFMLKDIVNDPNYSKSLSKTTISKLKQLRNITNSNQKMDAYEISKLFNIDQNTVNQLFLFYRTKIESNTKMTLHEFSITSLDMASQDEFKNMFDKNVINSLEVLKTLSDDNIINSNLDQNTMKDQLNKLGLNLDDDILSLLYIYYTGYNTDSKLTLDTFAKTALEISKIPSYKSYFSSDDLNLLEIIAYYNKPLTKSDLYQKFGININLQAKLDSVLPSQITPIEFINFLFNNQEIVQNLDSTTLSFLTNLKGMLENITQSYSTNQLANILQKDKDVVRVVYGFNDYKTKNIKISVKELINFLYANKSNPLLTSYLANVNDTLNLAYLIVNNTKNSYDYKNISKIISIDENEVKQIFGVYDYNHFSTTLTPLEFVNLILNNKDDKLLSGKISNSMIDELNVVKRVIIKSINKEKLSSSKLGSLLGIDNDTVSLLFGLYNTKYIKSNNKISLKNYVDFIVKDVMNNKDYSANFDKDNKEKLTTINILMANSLNDLKYTSNESYNLLSNLSDNLDKTLIELVYMYYGSSKEYDKSWTMTVEKFINYLNLDIITDERFNDFLNFKKKTLIMDSKKTIDKSKDLIVSDKYSRVVLNTMYNFEDKDTYKFINSIENEIKGKDDIYIVGNSNMAVEMSRTFNSELNKITILTMIFIFLVVAITFKDLIIPIVLVLIIQTAVYLTMSAISVAGGSVYFISLLIVQAILMGATIDYAIVYTSYYRESRLTMGIKDSVINAYNRSINTIISSSSILIIVTLVVSGFASMIAAKICETISEGTFVSVILILFVLPGVLATTDKLICRKGYYKEK